MPEVDAAESSGGESVQTQPVRNEEIELKLRLDPGQVEKFRRSALLRSLAKRKPNTKHLKSTYFDTKDLSLRKKGIALRVREDGARRCQTVKVPAPGANGTQHFREFETALDGLEPDLSQFADSDVAALLPGKRKASSLHPIFTTDVRRRVLDVRHGSSDIEVALDLGEVRSETRVMPICEAELELKSGRSEDLFALALALHENLPFRLERRTKAARGYGLFTGDPPGPKKADPIGLTRDLTVQEAFPVIAHGCVAHILANQAPVLEGSDPEGVHQMRVGVRRLRALVSMFGNLIRPNVKAHLADELRWLQRQLGPARDWDVFILETLDHIHEHVPKDSGLDLVCQCAEEARSDAYERARETIENGRFTALMLRLDIWLDKTLWANRAEHAATLDLPLRQYSDGMLRRLDRRMRKLGDRHEELTEEQFHNLRIRGKRMRYSAEFFAELYDAKAVRQLLKAVRAIQDRLGSLNDAVVARDLLDELQQRTASNRSRKTASARALGMVEGWNFARIERDLARFPEVWKSYRAVKRYWR
ncbi:MAG: CHAD domain-containing protein [Alphaproteobacteria bacterium]|nr:CHAD domain-containing protein [Alphaproteobacteria bacterium]